MVQPDRPVLAIFLRLAAIVLIATMFMLVKYAGEHGVATPEIMFWRQAITLPLLGGWLAATGGLARLKTDRLPAHGWRAIVGMSAMGMNFLAAILLPLAEATTLSFAAPLFAVIITALFLADRVGKWRWSAVLIGLAGVVIIAGPGSGAVDPLGVALGIGGAAAVAVVSFQIRSLAKSEDSLACVFWFAAFGAMMTGVFLPFHVTGHPPWIWLTLLGVGISGTIGQWLLTLSLKYGTVATVVVMDYSALIWATAYGWLIWDRLPVPETWIGAPIIIVAGIIIVWREHHLSRPVSPASAQEGIAATLGGNPEGTEEFEVSPSRISGAEEKGKDR